MLRIGVSFPPTLVRRLFHSIARREGTPHSSGNPRSTTFDHISSSLTQTTKYQMLSPARRPQRLSDFSCRTTKEPPLRACADLSHLTSKLLPTACCSMLQQR